MKYLSSKHVSKSGFTIVELLIVIVVIGILAAITIVAYNGIQQRTRIANLVATNTQISKKLLAFQAERGNYPTTLGEANINGGAANLQYSFNNLVNPQTFCVTSTIATTSQKIESGLLTSSDGVCAGHTSGGAVIITNLAINPSLGANLTAWGGNTVTGAARIAVTDLTGFNWAYSATTSALGSRIFLSDAAATLTTGTPHTASAWVKLTAGLSLSLGASDSTGVTAYGTQTPCGNGIATGAWQRCSITFTPTLATWRISTRQASAGTGSIAATGMMITAGNTDYQYLDGNSPGWSWTVPASANNTTSSGPQP